MMPLARGTAVLVAVGLLGTPLAALYCNQTDMAAMACCQGDMPHCNMPDKTEDCCRRVPASHETSAVGSKADRLDKPRLSADPLGMPALPGTMSVPVLGAASVLSSASVRAAPAPSPPRSPILRI